MFQFKLLKTCKSIANMHAHSQLHQGLMIPWTNLLRINKTLFFQCSPSSLAMIIPLKSIRFSLYQFKLPILHHIQDINLHKLIKSTKEKLKLSRSKHLEDKWYLQISAMEKHSFSRFMKKDQSKLRCLLKIQNKSHNKKHHLLQKHSDQQWTQFCNISNPSRHPMTLRPSVQTTKHQSQR